MSEIEHIPLISLGVIKTSLDSIDNVKLVEEITSHDGNIASHFLVNKNHTYYEDQRYPFGKPEAEKLIHELTKKVSSVLGREMVLSEIWTLTLKEGQSVSAHTHKSNTYINQSEYFSIAYYANAPERSADLIFMVDACNTIESSVTVKAETGSLVIFNSFIMHMTNRHDNKDENRIVVSANFWPKQPDTTPTQDWSAYSRLEWEDYSSTIQSGIKTFLLIAHTEFGDEPYTLTIFDESRAQISSKTGKQDITNFELTDSHFKCSIPVETPMVTNVDFVLRFNENGEVDGLVDIGLFADIKLTGTVA